MNNKKELQQNLGNLLQSNKLAILLELFVVFAPLYLGLAASDRLGSNQINLGSDLILLGGPLSYLGLIVSIVFLWIVSRLRGANWITYGLKRPNNWFFTILKSLGVALAVLGTVVIMINPLLSSLPNLEPRDMSQFDILTGNLPNLILALVIIWVTAAFLEEVLWRGYLMNRLIDLMGKKTWPVLLLIILISAIIFGLGHGYQGTMGMLKTGAIGLVFGLAYFSVGRNLWPLIIAHGLIDTLDMITHYLGG